MNNTVIIYLKAVIAFLVPVLTALGAALGPYELGDAAPPTVIGWIIISAASLVAGLAGLGSFLSRSYADHQDEKADPTSTNPKPAQ